MKHKIKNIQNTSRKCLVCGTENKFGIKTKFYETTENEVIGLFLPREEHQSYPNTTHGGISAAILDEVIGRAIMSFYGQSTFGVTIELKVRYKKPVPLGVELKAIGRITKDNGRVFEGTGEIYLPDGDMAVSAEGRYLRRQLGQITDTEFIENEWATPNEEFPDEILL